MSLLDGPHTVFVEPLRTNGRSKYGTYVKSYDPPVEVAHVAVDPHGSESYSGWEAKDESSVNDQITIRGRGVWPGGNQSIITFNGVKYDQKGEPKQFSHGRSGKTHHWKVRAARRSAEVK